MRRKTILVLVMLCLFASTGFAGTMVDSLGEMKDIVRQLIGVESTSLLPDSTLRDICRGSVLWTSVDIGGVEYQYKFVTVADQGFYALPDTITKVLFASYISHAKGTYAFRSIYPQYFTEEPAILSDDAGAWDIPLDYNYWADTIQIMPIPKQAGDTIVLKCFIEHRDITTDTASINLSPPYSYAAIIYACGYSCVSLGMFDKANWFLAEYEKMKKSLTETYTRGFDILKQ